MALVRVSVANLAHRLFYDDDGFHRIAFLSPSALKKGIKRYQALGGGVQLTSQGVSILESLGAREFEKDESTGLTDARFVTDAQNLETVFQRFKLLSGTTNSFEYDPTDDIRHELCNWELPGILPVLNSGEMRTVKIFYRKNAPFFFTNVQYFGECDAFKFFQTIGN